MSSTTKTVNMGLVMGLAIGAALGGLLFGYDTAVISGAVDAIDHNFVQPRHELSEIARNAMTGNAVGIALWGCFFGSLIAGPLATALGRRTGMLIAAVIFFASSILAGYPETGFGGPGSLGVHALTPFMIYRFCGGVAIGMVGIEWQDRDIATLRTQFSQCVDQIQHLLRTAAVIPSDGDGPAHAIAQLRARMPIR